MSSYDEYIRQRAAKLLPLTQSQITRLTGLLNPDQPETLHRKHSKKGTTP